MIAKICRIWICYLVSSIGMKWETCMPSFINLACTNNKDMNLYLISFSEICKIVYCESWRFWYMKIMLWFKIFQQNLSHIFVTCSLFSTNFQNTWMEKFRIPESFGCLPHWTGAWAAVLIPVQEMEPGSWPERTQGSSSASCSLGQWRSSRGGRWLRLSLGRQQHGRRWQAAGSCARKLSEVGGGKVVPAKGRSSAARRGEATARHRAAWRRWPVGVALQDEGKRGECGEAMADTLCAGGEKEKRARVGGLAGAATRWKGGRRSDRGPECATGGRGAVPATGKTGERTGGLVREKSWARPLGRLFWASPTYLHWFN
jgi:hypothetical protein